MKKVFLLILLILPNITYASSNSFMAGMIGGAIGAGLASSNNNHRSTQDVFTAEEIKAVVQCRFEDSGCLVNTCINRDDFWRSSCIRKVISIEEKIIHDTGHKDAKVIGLNEYYDHLYVTW